jgi:septal ring factor EnvC (AmiA/AmiB activator)
MTKGNAFVLPALLALALVAGPAAPARAGGSGNKVKPVQEQLRKIEESLKAAFDKVADEIKALKSDLRSAKEEREDVQRKLGDAIKRIGALDRTVAGLKHDLEGLRQQPAPAATAAPKSEHTGLDDIRERLDRIEKMLDRPLVPGRVALYPPATREVPKAGGPQLRQIRKDLDRLDEVARRGFDRVREELAAVRGELKTCRDDRTLAQLKLQAALSALGALRPQLDEMRGELAALRARPVERVALYPPGDPAALDDIRARLGDIERTLRRTPPARGYVALYPAAGPTGRVVLTNTYGETLTFVVNGRSYAVAPGASMPLDAEPAGALTYEVISPTWGLRDRRTTMLAAGETLTLTAR